jgi:hypothetical protein
VEDEEGDGNVEEREREDGSRE